MAWYQDLNVVLWLVLMVFYIISARARRFLTTVFLMLICIAIIFGGWFDAYLTIEGKLIATLVVIFVPLIFWVRV